MMTTEERIVAMAKQGVRPGDIAVRVQRAPQTVYDYLKKARKNGHRFPKFASGPSPEGRATVVSIPAPVIRKLKPYAARRGLTAAELVAELARLIAEHDLVAAVLSDERGRIDA